MFSWLFCWFSFLKSKHFLKILWTRGEAEWLAWRNYGKAQVPTVPYIMHLVFLLYISVVWGCVFNGWVLTAFFFLTAYFLRTNPWRWEKDLSKMRICLSRSWKYTGKRFSQNEDFGLCVVFTSVWFFGSFLLWKIESWLNMSTTQLNITFWGKFILCTPLPFYCDEKREEKKKNERLNGL